jgi:hypothetical protein
MDCKLYLQMMRTWDYLLKREKKRGVEVGGGGQKENEKE